MKKGIAVALVTVFGGWSLGFAVVSPSYEGGGATIKQAEQGSRFVPGQVLLKMKSGFAPAEAAQAVAARLRHPIGDDGIFILDVGKGDVPAAVQALRGMRGVAAAAPNWIRPLHQGGPNDAGYGYKWDLNNPGPTLPLKCVYSSLTGEVRTCPTPGADIDWEVAYDTLTTQGTLAGPDSVTVAVIDTGVDLVHPDLQFKLAPGGRDFVGTCDINDPLFDPGTCADDVPMDSYGHGTHVAGIALGETNNGVWSAGVAFDERIRVMPLRVCDDNGQCPDSSLIAAIQWARTHGADVINFSLGGPEISPVVEAEIDAAWGAGLVVVASAGNEGTSTVSFPAAFPNVIAVGSTNWEDGRAGYSNYGAALDVMAPGGEIDMGFWGLFPDDNPFAGIYSLMPTYPSVISYSLGIVWVDDDTREPYDYTYYGWLNGTSMAAPQVSGLAALLLAVGVTDSNGNGRLNDEIRGIIEATVDDLGTAGLDPYYGHGRINVDRAVLAALSDDGGGEPPPPEPVNESPTAAFSSSVNGLTVTFTDRSSDSDGSIEGWLWDFGDGSASTVQNPTHTYAGNGTYTVRLTVTDDDGASATATASVRVKKTGGGGGGKGKNR